MNQSEILNSTSAMKSLLERNNAARRTLNIPIIVTGTDNKPQNCIATSMCVNGILLISDSNSFTPNEILKLEFRLLFDGVSKRCSIMAKLAGVMENTLIIYFHQFNAEIFVYINKLMFDIDLRKRIPRQNSAVPVDLQIPQYAS